MSPDAIHGCKPVAIGTSRPLWDPLNVWPAARWWLWAGLAAVTICFQGPDFARSLRPTPGEGVDFFQEWSSARSFFRGDPVYSDLSESADHFLDLRVKLTYPQVPVNTHPPTAILLLIPLAVLDYSDAFLLWNLLSLAAFALSLGLVLHELGIPISIRACLPIVVILLLCNPLRQQVNQGQFGGLLSLMVTGVWIAARSGRPMWAGALLGAAAAIKVFPGFLFLYFILRRQWTVVAAGALSLAALTGLAAAVFGMSTYATYIREVLPRVPKFRVLWQNSSLAGLACKLFDPDPESVNRYGRVVCLWDRPEFANVAWGLSSAIVLTLTALVILRSRSQLALDRAHGVSVTAMLLVSPVTWDHYFLLLLLPLALVWQWLPSTGPGRLLFLLTVMGLCLNPIVLCDALIPGGYPPDVWYPRHTLTLLSLQCYAQLCLFGMGLAAAMCSIREQDRGENGELSRTVGEPSVEPPSCDQCTAASQDRNGSPYSDTVLTDGYLAGPNVVGL